MVSYRYGRFNNTRWDRIISLVILVLSLLSCLVAHWCGYEELAKISIVASIVFGIVFLISLLDTDFFLRDEYDPFSPYTAKDVSVILLLLAWIGIAPTFYRVITNNAIAIWQDRFYNLLNQSRILNILFCLCIVYCFCYWCKRIREKMKTQSSFRFSCLIIIVLVYFILYWKSPYVYTKIVWIIDYRILLSVLLLFPFSFYLWSTIAYLKNEEEAVQGWWARDESHYYERRNKLSSFSLEGIGVSNTPEDLNKYALSIVIKLLKTDLRTESFAVGITSEWGAGKTTFLNVLKKQFGERVDVVEFNPWMCRTPEQLTSDFFSSLRHQLSKTHKELSNPIKEYAKCLKSVSLRFPALTLKLSGFSSEKSLFEKKKELSDKFSMLNKKIVVFIDDIDRLESSEVLEVLRLIRNTADLKNVIYIAAYDKEYVTTVLEEKKIAAPTSYLEKIFQVEIQLPLVPKERIISTLFNEITNNGRIESKYLEDIFIESNQELILKVINSYRKAKRFARLFLLNYEHLSLVSFNPLVWQDVFWLELLQVSDKSTYDYFLCNNPKAILSEVNGCYIYYKNPENNQRFEDRPITQEILLKLFGEVVEGKINEYGVRNTKYYNQYFTMEFNFSKKDLEKLLEANDVEQLVIEWGKRGKPIEKNKLSQVILDYNTNQLIEKKTNLINGLFLMVYYGCDDGSYHYGEDVFKGLEINGKEELIRWFTDKFEKDWELSKMSRVLSRYEYLLVSLNDEETIMKPFIEKTIDVYFNKHPHSTVLDLKRGNNELFIIYKELYSRSKKYYLDCLIERYSQMDNRPTNKEFDALEIEKGSALESIYGERERYIQIIKNTCCSDKPIIQTTQTKKRRFSFFKKKS